MTSAGYQSMVMYVPDILVGGFIGFFCWMICLLLVPVIAAVLSRKQCQQALILLVCTCLACTIGASFLSPYSIHKPKRIILSYLQKQQAPNSSMFDAYYAIGTTDPIPVARVISGSDITGLNMSRAVEQTRRDRLGLYPFDRSSRAIMFPAPLPPAGGTWGSHPPRIVKDRVVPTKHSNIVHLQLQWEKPGWGCFNISGPLKSWSFTEDVTTMRRKEGIGFDHVVRFTQGGEDTVWPFWLELEHGSQAKIEATITYFHSTPALESIVNDMPNWVAVTTSINFLLDLAL